MYKCSYNSCCNWLETATRRSFSSVPLKFNWALGVGTIIVFLLIQSRHRRVVASNKFYLITFSISSKTAVRARFPRDPSRYAVPPYGSGCKSCTVGWLNFILFWVFPVGPKTHNLYMIFFDAEINTRLLTEGAFSQTFPPDGSTVHFRWFRY